MARSKRKKISRKLTMTGKYTYYITIPREYIEALGWRKKQKLTLRLSGKKIIVEDWKK
jgi:bifunctional DNA-binding transcriptional regulator/antitoxin component of YhaV-PrlF toxin-antitoxin module